MTIENTFTSVASPVDITTSSFNFPTSQLAIALANLAAYLQTWDTPEGLAGVIATWWSSSVDTAEPHPMNQAPIIQGAVRLHEAGVAGQWLDWACEQGEALMRQIEPDGLLRNGWGDLPGRSKAPVIGFAASGALYALAGATGEDRYGNAADRILFGYEERFASGNMLYHGVANQAARWALTRLQRYCLLGEGVDRVKAGCIGRELLPELIMAGECRGGMRQSRSSDILISVYGGKCLYPLLVLYAAIEDPAFLEAAHKIANYLMENCTEEENLFISYAAPRGVFYRVGQRLSSIDRRLFRGLLGLYRVRRAMITSWERIECPVYIARTADSIRGLATFAAQENKTIPLVNKLLNALLSRQLAHGGFPNTVGFNGIREQKSWQDVVAPTRWNGYVFQLLADLVVASGITELPQPTVSWPEKHYVGPKQCWQLLETEQMLALYSNENEGNSKTLWEIEKKTGCTSVSPGWQGELTGSRTLERMLSENGE